jgi:hypothetical protein
LEHWRDWAAYKREGKTFLDNNKCLSDLGAATCLTVNVPLRDMQRSLGAPLEQEIQRNSDMIQLYARLFLVVAFGSGWQ